MLSDEDELRIVRRAFARQIMFAARLEDARLEAAFAEVPRERFLGPGPWLLGSWLEPYRRTPDADPVFLYIDTVIGILPERFINNGQPSGHARWLASAAIKDGDHVVHVGTGTGYYTAIMSRLAGPGGSVTGIELDPALAARAKTHLAGFANVTVVEGDGARTAFDAADVIYVNAGVTHPAALWLDRLAEGGRLILPLTTDKGFMRNDPPVPIERRGAVFRIERRSSELLAQWVSPVAIIPCEGGRDAAAEAALSAAFEKGGWKDVTRLYRHEEIPEDRCWLRAPGWCLAYS